MKIGLNIDNKYKFKIDKFLENYFDNTFTTNKIINLILKNLKKEMIINKSIELIIFKSLKYLNRIIKKIIKFLLKLNQLDELIIYEIINFPFNFLFKKNLNYSSSSKNTLIKNKKYN